MSISSTIIFKIPTVEDGMSIFRLIQRCPPLDTNSSYCNFLQASHFANTSVAAERDGKLVGFVSGYLVPGKSDTLFIWQVAVDESMRGIGLASKMLTEILARSACKSVQYLETTITQDNQPSWHLFRRLGKTLLADFTSAVWLEKKNHFDGQHETEELVRIGPFKTEQV